MTVCVDEKSIVTFTTKDDVPESSRVILPADQCDVCSASAHNVAVSGLHAENRLMFCNHHLKEQLTGLLDSGFRVEKHEYSL